MQKKMKVWLESQTRGFKTTDGPVEYEAVIFSSEFNRNKAFFDISKMKRWSDKLNKVLLNNSHDGKYFSVTTDKIKELRIETDENGITEAYAIIESTNPEKVANPSAVTGFSIELEGWRRYRF
jgi:hypothetical protein